MGSEKFWVPDGKGVQKGGDIGGDGQATDSYSVRYHHTDRSGALVTVYFFGERIEGEFRVKQLIELMVCENRSHPGSSELWSECLHHTFNTPYTSTEDAGLAARQYAEQHRAADLALDTDWGGLAPWERDE